MRAPARRPGRAVRGGTELIDSPIWGRVHRAVVSFRDRVTSTRASVTRTRPTPLLQGEASTSPSGVRATPAPTLRSRLRRTVLGGGRGRAGPRDRTGRAYAPRDAHGAPRAEISSAPPRPSAWRRAASGEWLRANIPEHAHLRPSHQQFLPRHRPQDVREPLTRELRELI